MGQRAKGKGQREGDTTVTHHDLTSLLDLVLRLFQ